MVRISDTGERDLSEFRAQTGGFGDIFSGAVSQAGSTVSSAVQTVNPYSPLPVQDFDFDPYQYGLGAGVSAAASAYNPQSWLPSSWQYDPPVATPAQNAWADVSSWSTQPAYDLSFEDRGYQSPMVAPQPSFADMQIPWYQPDPWTPQVDNSGGFLGGLGGSVVSGLADFGQGALGVAQNVPLFNRDTFVQDDAAMERLRDRRNRMPEYLISGNAAIEDLTGYDPNQLPFGLGYLTDAVNPLNIATAGIAPSVPILGSTLTGNFGKRLAGEMAIDIGARFAGEQAAGDLGASIPLFGELEPWQRGLIGGLAGGVGAAGGVKALDEGLPRVNAWMNEEVPGVPGVTRGEFGGGTFGRGGEPDVPRELPMGKTADEAISPSPAAFTPDAPSRPSGGPPSGLNQPGVDVPFDGQRAILDALQEQIRYRRSGAAEEAIRAGRAQQAQGIGDAFAAGGTLDEVTANLSSGMRTGRMLEDGAPLNLTPEAVQSATNDIVRFGLEPGNRFDGGTAIRALNKLLNGQKLQPKEIKLLGKVWGAEMEDAIRLTNANRIAIRPELTAADKAEIDRLAALGGKRAARAEVEARAQHKVAERLQEQLRMNPTNKSLKRAVGEARTRAIRLETDAERFLLDHLEKIQERIRTQRVKAAEDEWMRALDDPRPDQFQRTLARQEDQAQSWLGRRQDRALVEQTDRAATAEYKRSGLEALDNALKMVDKADLPAEVQSQVRQAMDVWLQSQAKVLDALGDDAPNVLRQIYAAATGELTDSWTQKLIIQTGLLRSALEESGMNADLARAIARKVQDAEIARRYGDNIPAHVQKSLDQLKLGQDVTAVTVQSMGGISQVLKNTTLGIGDLAVFGQQGAKLTLTNVIPLLAGTINRALHLAGAGLDVGFTANNLPKHVQKALDGLQTSSKGIVDFGTAAADDVAGYATVAKAAERAKAGTLLSLIPGIGPVIDRPVVRLTEFLTDLQFKHVLGWMRDTAYEGNLMLLKAAGEDITDPLVRQRAAGWANVASGAAELATRSTRREAERGVLLTPSLTRAQIQQGGQILRGLHAWLTDPLWLPTFGKVSRNLDASARVDRVLAASTIASTVASALAVGKLLNDHIGITDFVFDPSENGFGSITLEDGTVVSVFPQTQVPRAFARAIRVLVEDGVTQDDVAPLLTEFGKLSLGRFSPAARLGAQAFDTGFNPEQGSYQFGDFDLGWRQNLLSAVTPPIAQSLIREGFDAVRTPLEAFGVSTYEESAYSALDRKLIADPEFGKPRSELEPHERKAADEKYGKPESRNPEIAQSQARAAEIASEARAYQEKIDGWLRAGQKPDGTPYTVDDWKADRAKNDRYIAGRYDELYADVDWKDKALTPVDRYYDFIAKAVNPETDEVDWDRVENWLKAQSWEDQAYISRNTNLNDTEMEKEYRADVKKIAASGYFDLTEGKREFREENPEIAELIRKWGYSKLSIAAEDQLNLYRSQQAIDDAALESGEMDPEKWRDNRKTRQAQLAAAKDAIYAGLREDGESTEPLDQFFATIEANKPNGIDVDWDAVDRWVATQPADVQEMIDSYAGTALTPKVQEYRDAVAKIEASMYWDINDRVAQKVVEAQGGTWPEGMTAERYYGEIEMAVFERLHERGYSRAEAIALTGVVMRSVTEDYTKIASKVRGAMRDADPELARLLIEWGYWEPGKEDTGILVGTGALR